MKKETFDTFFQKEKVTVSLNKDGIVRIKDGKKAKKFFNRNVDKKVLGTKIIENLKLKTGINSVKKSKILKVVEKLSA